MAPPHEAVGLFNAEGRNLGQQQRRTEPWATRRIRGSAYPICGLTFDLVYIGSL